MTLILQSVVKESKNDLDIQRVVKQSDNDLDIQSVNTPTMTLIYKV